MSYRTIAHHARSVRLTTSDGVFWLGSREQALPLQKVLISPKGVTTTDLCEVAESEGHAIGVAGVVIVGVAVVVHITEVVGVAGIRRTLPPVVRRTIDLFDLAVSGAVIRILRLFAGFVAVCVSGRPEYFVFR